MKKISSLALKITVAALVGLMIVIPFFFQGHLVDKLKKLANDNINGTLDFKETGISFFSHFPNLTVTFSDFTLMGPAPYDKDTLASGEEIAVGINLLSLVRQRVEVGMIYIGGGNINLINGIDGKANFDIMLPSSDSTAADTPASAEDSETPAVKIHKIKLRDCKLRFEDVASGFVFLAEELDYTGKGNFAEAVFDLKSNLEAKKLTVDLGTSRYIDHKRLTASMLTSINTDSLSFRFIKNSLKLQGVPLEFSGFFKTLADGFDINIAGNTERMPFESLFTLMPAEFTPWFEDTRFRGDTKLGFAFTGIASDSLDTFPDFTASMEVQKGSIKSSLADLPLENIEFRGSLTIPQTNFDKINLTVDTVGFTIAGEQNGGEISITMGDSIAVKGALGGFADMDALSKAIGLEEVAFGGALEYRAKLDGVYDSAKRTIPAGSLFVKWSNGSVFSNIHTSRITDLNASVLIESPDGTYAGTRAELRPVWFVFDGKPFNLEASLKNFDNLQYDIVSKGDLDLTNIYKLLGITGAAVDGYLLSDLSLKGNQADAKAGAVNKLQNSGTLELRSFKYKSDSYAMPFQIPLAALRIDGDKAWLDRTTVRSGESSITLEGYASNFMGYYFEGGALSGQMKISSDKLALEDFMPVEAEESDAVAADLAAVAAKAEPSAGVIQLPERMAITLDASIKELSYDSILVKNLRGRVAMRDKEMQLTGGRLNIAGAAFSLNARYAPESLSEAAFSFAVKADSFNIRRAYNEIPMIRELFSSAASMNGDVSMKYDIAGKLDQNMSPVLPSLRGGGQIVLEDIKVKGLKVLGAISKATGRDSLDNPSLKGVVIKSTISDNIIKIERTRMRVFGFRPRFEGEASLDGRLNIRFRLGLPPLGIIGIPITITGTMDNPKINMRRSREGDEIVTDTESDD